MAAIRRACARCRERYAQEGGLCRRCQRETGVDVRSNFERERDRVALLRLLADQNPPRPVPSVAPAPLPTRVIDGVEYQVTFDGSRR